MNTYEKIRKIRNQKLFNGEPPLEFGCICLDSSDDERLIINNLGAKVFFLHGAEWVVPNKILGKPVSLNDVFQLIENKTNICWITGDIEKLKGVVINNIDQDEVVLKEEYKFSNECRKVLKCLDISKDIKDQDEETLLQILELIK